MLNKFEIIRNLLKYIKNINSQNIEEGEDPNLINRIKEKIRNIKNEGDPKNNERNLVNTYYQDCFRSILSVFSEQNSYYSEKELKYKMLNQPFLLSKLNLLSLLKCAQEYFNEQKGDLAAIKYRFDDEKSLKLLLTDEMECDMYRAIIERVTFIRNITISLMI